MAEVEYRDFEFIRTATAGDDLALIRQGSTLWRLPSGDETWISASTVRMNAILGEKARAGIDARLAELEKGDPEEVQTTIRSHMEAVAAARDPRQRKEPSYRSRSGAESLGPDIRPAQPTEARGEPALEPLDGEVDGWRWSHVEGEITLDNRPRIDAYDPIDGEHPPKPQQTIVPLDVILSIADTFRRGRSE